MVKLLLAMLLLPASLALAAEEQAAPQSNPMAGWVPPKLKNEAKDKEEIHAVFKAMEAAGKKGDVEAAAALVDFPVLMVTDDSKGEGKGETWDREKWIQVMRPFYEKPKTGMKVTHKPTVFLLSDSLASVNDLATVTMGDKHFTTRSSTLLIRRDGKWLLKAMAEGGWGDVAQGRAGGAQGPASEGTGSEGAPAK